MAVVKFPNVIKEDPPLIQMNGYKGLYISVMAYEYYTGNNIDYLEIEEWMDSGKFEEVNNKYSDYILWVWQNKQNIQGYLLKVCKIGYQNVSNFKIEGGFTGDRNLDKTKAMEYLSLYGYDEIPTGYVLHHDMDSGVFQLVQESVHQEFSHYGGYYYNK